MAYYQWIGGLNSSNDVEPIGTSYDLADGVNWIAQDGSNSVGAVPGPSDVAGFYSASAIYVLEYPLASLNYFTASASPGTGYLGEEIQAIPGGTPIGALNVGILYIQQPVTSWIFPGAITTRFLDDEGDVTFSSGASLTITGTTQTGSATTGQLLGLIDAAMTLTGATLVYAAGLLDLGLVTGTTGALTVSSGSVFKTAGSINVGEAGSGSLTLVSGGTVISTLTPALSNPPVLVIGDGPASTGGAASQDAVTVSGTGSLLNLNGNTAVVGSGESGVLTVASGGSAAFGTLRPDIAASLTVGLGGAGTVNVTGAGSTLMLSGATFIGVNATGIVNVTAGAVLIETAAPNIVGNQIGFGVYGSTLGAGLLNIDDGVASFGDPLSLGNYIATGTLLVANSGTLNAQNGLVIGASATGTATLSTGGRIVLGAGSAIAGDYAGSTGTLTIDAGASFTTSEQQVTSAYVLQVGEAAKAAGTVVVTGAGALLDLNDNAMTLGYAGNGALDISAGGVAELGTANVTAVASLSLGRSGQGQVTVDGAGSALVLTGAMYAGRAAGSEGSVVLTDDATLTETAVGTGNANDFGSERTNSGTASYGGAGYLTITTGASATFADAVGFGSNGSTGVGLVDGGTLAVGLALNVGTGSAVEGGTGRLTVQDGGVARSSGLYVGTAGGIEVANRAGTTGTVAVTGSGSLLDAGGGAFDVGSYGTGTLSVMSGGTAQSGGPTPTSGASFTLGAFAGVGTATVDGRGSELDIGGSITIGGTGNSTAQDQLSATDGGEVDSRSLTLWANGTLSADSVSQINIGGSEAGPGINITSSGTLTAHGGVIEGNIDNGGTLSNDGALKIEGGLTTAYGPLGLLSVAGGSTTEITGAVSSEHIAFGGPALIILDDLPGSGVIPVTVTASQIGDAFDLAGVAKDDVSVDVLSTVTAGFGSIEFDGLQPRESAFLSDDGHGGTLATLGLASGAPCYCPGTLILTDRGERPVESLGIGDIVITASGERCPIRWIGRRSYAGRLLAGNPLMLPVTFGAGALADGVPHTALVVSPGHAMFVDGQLIPAWRLINGVTITQSGAEEDVTYVHVELHHHDLLLANGAAAESFLEGTGFRWQFHNAGAFFARYPDMPAIRPLQARLEDGFGLQHIRARLAARAGVTLGLKSAGGLRGYVDQAGPERICGWAQDLDSRESPVMLEIAVGGAPVLCVLANGFRADLREAGCGTGCHAFDVRLAVAGTVTVRRVWDGAALGMTQAAQERLVA